MFCAIANGELQGHKTSDCKENRKFDLNDIPDETPDQAWASLKKADAERDLEDFRAVRLTLENVYVYELTRTLGF